MAYKAYQEHTRFCRQCVEADQKGQGHCLRGVALKRDITLATADDEKMKGRQR